MLIVQYPRDLKQHIGRELGPTEWITVSQAMIDAFAQATGDHQWIHVDIERAKREMPGGKTIAHGYLTLSLIPRMAAMLLQVQKLRHGLNYGSNRVRFITPVPAGSRLRLRQRILSVEDMDFDGVRVTVQMTVDIEDQERPALVAEIITVQYA
jgi:acyl dehydratase